MQKRQNTVWRRRKCTNCQAIFSTHETPDYAAALQVKNSSGHLQAFSRDKLFLSLHSSLQYRPRPLEDAAGLTDTIISKLRNASEAGTLDSRQITHVASVALQRFDKVAAVNYQAFHPIE
ncbi:MAG TPA: hypothetical protein VLG37_03060 [Candidatus Saccharimonadales bacterium]|nr:hypothetical protein [Candidatus Saccharimonadales bacterium]